MPTSSTPPVGCAHANAGTHLAPMADSRYRAHRRTTLISDMSFTVSSRWAAIFAKSLCCIPRGFSRHATAPASIERNVVIVSCGSPLALQITMGTGCISMMRRVASKPFIFGISISIRITSGEACVRN